MMAAGDGTGGGVSVAADDRRRLSVLVADDQPVNQQLVCSLLERRGHRVAVANDGAEAVASWQKGAFDVILMDVRMPVMDGLAATAQIREAERGTGARVRIVALTAQAAAADGQRCLAAGMDGVVTKPFRLEALVAAVEGDTGAGATTGAVARAGSGPVDKAELMSRVGHDAATLAGLVRIVMRTGPGSLAAVGQTVARRDRLQLEAEAHKLKGILGGVSATAAMDRAAALEANAGTAPWPEIETTYAALQAEFGRAVPALEELAQEGASAVAQEVMHRAPLPKRATGG